MFPEVAGISMISGRKRWSRCNNLICSRQALSIICRLFHPHYVSCGASVKPFTFYTVHLIIQANYLSSGCYTELTNLLQSSRRMVNSYRYFRCHLLPTGTRRYQTRHVCVLLMFLLVTAIWTRNPRHFVRVGMGTRHWLCHCRCRDLPLRSC